MRTILSAFLSCRLISLIASFSLRFASLANSLANSLAFLRSSDFPRFFFSAQLLQIFLLLFLLKKSLPQIKHNPDPFLAVFRLKSYSGLSGFFKRTTSLGHTGHSGASSGFLVVLHFGQVR